MDVFLFLDRLRLSSRMLLRAGRSKDVFSDECSLSLSLLTLFFVRFVIIDSFWSFAILDC